jgi:hypothetical protein
MKNREDSLGSKVLHQRIPDWLGLEQDVIHMVIRLAVCWDAWTSQFSLLKQSGQLSIVGLENSSALIVDGLEVFELSGKKRTSNFTRKERRSCIDPSVFIDDPADELGSIGPFFADDFRSFKESFVVNAQGATFTAYIVFGFMEALGPEMPDGAKGSAFVERVDALCSASTTMRRCFHRY